MAYNQGLAVGLAVGLPCFIVLLGTLFFLRRNRRLQQKEDREGTELDVEMGENGSFKEFSEALHQPVDPASKTNMTNGKAGNIESHAETSTVAKSSSSVDSTSNSVSSKTQSSPEHGKHSFLQSSVADSSHSYQNMQSSNHASASPNGRSNSVYDFYNTVIPIMPSAAHSENTLTQPPAFSRSGNSERQSFHSSRGSLLGGDSSSKSLENLAKQLNTSSFFENGPSRAGTTLTKSHSQHSRLPPPSLSKSSSVNELTPYENGGINDHFVNERSHLHQDQHQKHPYRERAMPHDDSVTMGLENNFDNNITANTDFSQEPDVVFK